MRAEESFPHQITGMNAPMAAKASVLRTKRVGKYSVHSREDIAMNITVYNRNQSLILGRNCSCRCIA